MIRSFHVKPLDLLVASAVLLAVALVGCQALEKAVEHYEGASEEGVGGVGEVFETLDNGLRIRRPTRSWRAVQHENVIVQRMDYSCGSAALATLLRYYFEDEIDEQVVLRAIFQRIAQSADPKAELQDRVTNGFSMLDLLNAAKDLGYLGAVVRIPISKLAQSPAPVIVRIEKYNYKHFVVFRGLYEDTVYLADPIRGNVRLSVQEFLKQWSGESLFLGKPGFGLPKEYPLAIHVKGPAQPELDIAREALFPPR